MRRFEDCVLETSLVDREAVQGVDLIQTLRRLLRVRTAMFKDKKAIAVGQRESARANTTITNFNGVADQYRTNRIALEKLNDKGKWMDILLPLRREDIQGPDGAANEHPIHSGEIDAWNRPSEGRLNLAHRSV